MIPALRSLQPRSLVGRVFAVFSLTMLVFLASGLALFYRYQFLQHIEETQDNALTLVEVASQTIEDSVVIGDYDTVKRTLNKMLVQSPFKSAEFLDVGGGRIRVVAPVPTQAAAPAWLQEIVGSQLYDVNRVANVGGKDYGVVRLSFDERKLAAQMWTLVVETALMSIVVFALSLALMRSMLRRWLVNLGGLRSFEHDVAAGRITAAAALSADAPSEIQEAIQAVNRSADSLRAQFGQRIDSLMNSLMQHKSAMDQAAIVCEVDTNGRIAEVNDLFVDNSGFARADVVGMALAEVGLPNDPEQAWRPGTQVWNGEVALAGRNGLRQWRRTVVPMFDADGTVERYICIDIDITERKEFERALVENAKRQTLIAELGRKALAGIDLGDLFHEAAAAAARGLSAPGAALFEAGSNGTVLLRAASGRLADATGTTLACSAAALLPPPTPSLLPLRPWFAPLAERHGLDSGLDTAIGRAECPFGLIGVYDDGLRSFGEDDVNFLRGIATILSTALERQDAKERLTYLAQYDPLTSLPNRRQLALGLEAALTLAASQGERATVMFIDLDHFKNINDMLGHGVGDQLLVQAAERLQACVRSGDMVARLGGDEFALVLPGVGCDDALAASMAAAIIHSLGQPFHLQGQQLFVSASVGIASYPEHGDSAELLLKSADTAMYGAKSGGRNMYQFFVPEMHEIAALRLQTEHQLRLALERGEFLLHYQPKLNLAGGTVSGFEALLRWNHPQRGLVPPLEFVTILEETGLILPVGEWVIGEVCRQLIAWQDAGLPLSPVAINLSARQLQQDDLAGAIERIVSAAGVAPTLLEFELTESMLMKNPEAAVEILSRIKALGMRLSVDDFGTGYSSLAYLKRFPLDALKIDRTFVRDLPHDSDDAAITRAVIRMAHSLNLKVVAEGVENVAQIQELERYGCDEIQGYYVSRPLAPPAAAELLGREALGHKHKVPA